MGAKIENETQLIISVFNSSATYQNLQTTRCAVANLTSDINVFYRATFKEANPNGTLPLGWFRKAQTINAPQLVMVDAAVEISITDLTPINSQKTQATCTVEHITATKVFPKVYCRAFSATVEAIIHATRVKAFANSSAEQQHVNKLVELIGNCNDVVEKTAPNSPYSEVMADLNSRINSWRATANP
jgi:hypothetical protein